MVRERGRYVCVLIGESEGDGDGDGDERGKGTHQFVNQSDEGLEIFFNRQVEGVSVLEVDGDYVSCVSVLLVLLFPSLLLVPLFICTEKRCNDGSD